MDFRTLTSRVRRRNNFARVIALILAVVIFTILLATQVIRIFPYKAIHLDNQQFMNRKQFYSDLDLDGRSEQIVQTNYSGHPVLEVFANDESFMEVVRLSGELLDSKISMQTGDTDEDGYAEIFVLTIRNDSVLLNGYEFLGDDGHFITDLFIADYPPVSDNNNLRLVSFKVVKVPGDGRQKLLIMLRAGYNLTPRQLMLVDPHSMEVSRSLNSAAGYNSLFNYKNKEDITELILAGSSAFRNFSMDDTVLFNDNSGWLVCFSPDLQDMLLVKEYPDDKSYIFPFCRMEDRQLYYYVVQMKMEKGAAYLQKLDDSGIVVREVQLGRGLGKYYFMNPLLPSLEDIVILKEDTLLHYNQDLELTRKDAEGGEPFMEVIYLGRKTFETTNSVPFLRGDRLIFRDTTLKIIASSSPGSAVPSRGAIYTVKEYTDPADMIVAFRTQEGTLHYRLKRSSLYGIRFLVYAMVMLALYLFFFVLFRIQNYYYDRRYKIRQKIAGLQLQAVQNQLQPHFTFNVLNTIGSMILKADREQAYEYLNYFSDMLRSALLNRSGTEWQTGEELNFISTYMEMENLRFDNRFLYRQQIGQGTDLTRKVPKMSVQSFVENAVRHGLMHREGEGLLQVSVIEDDEHMTFIVEDNGIGREAAGKLQRNGAGMGNRILLEYMEVYNRMSRIKFIFRIEDLRDASGKATGTRITLKVPIDFGTTKNEL